MLTHSFVTAMVVGLNALLFSPTTTFVETYSIIPCLKPPTRGLPYPLVEYKKKGMNFDLIGLNKHQLNQLRYIQALDIAQDETDRDVEHLLWQGKRVLAHRVFKQGTTHKVLVKVHWQNDQPTWQDIAAVHIQQPEILVTYAFVHGLDKHPDWKWTLSHCDLDEQRAHIVKAFKATSDNGPWYKFGIEVPCSLKHALFLDRKNGNHLWREAIKMER